MPTTKKAKTATTTKKVAKKTTAVAVVPPLQPTSVSKPTPPKKATEKDEELQGQIASFIKDKFPEIVETFDDLTTNKKWEYLFQLLPYATPKMQATELGGGLENIISTQLKQLSSSTIKK